MLYPTFKVLSPDARWANVVLLALVTLSKAIMTVLSGLGLFFDFAIWRQLSGLFDSVDVLESRSKFS